VVRRLLERRGGLLACHAAHAGRLAAPHAPAGHRLPPERDRGGVGGTDR
jgi:hypothetical protein